MTTKKRLNSKQMRDFVKKKKTAQIDSVHCQKKNIDILGSTSLNLTHHLTVVGGQCGFFGSLLQATGECEEQVSHKLVTVRYRSANIGPQKRSF